jgi:acyl-CoA synthetase (AMP-forming)/AMP-acid ligase II
MLKTLGFRVSPDEVEEQLFSSGLIEGVVILGEADPEAGMVLIAHIVPRDARTFDERAFRLWSRRALPRISVLPRGWPPSSACRRC